MSGSDNKVLFERIALIGAGLIGSSLAHVVRRDGLAGHIAVSARTQATLDKIQELGLADSVHLDASEAAQDADLVVLCTPVGVYGDIAKAIAPSLKPGAIVTDVGSCKQSVIDDVRPHLPEGVHLVPGHPVAGTEHSGPEAGFAELFEGRWAILTPETDTDEDAIEAVADLWRRAGSFIEIMEARHHDQVLAITSHLPQLVAYTIVDTATGLEDHLKGEVVKFSAGGFRDFTRLAASDPVMWRDICLANKDAILDILGRFTEDLTALQRAIRRGEAKTLEESFARTRAIRRGVIDAKQD
ncbi:MAG: prephenate/arogenate dehydrogenase family protein [Rhodospirillales bacterium]|nr:prephenate/arogenate dehydrogenase family protein [Rhodospirillales bacterium]